MGGTALTTAPRKAQDPTAGCSSLLRLECTAAEIEVQAISRRDIMLLGVLQLVTGATKACSSPRLIFRAWARRHKGTRGQNRDPAHLARLPMLPVVSMNLSLTRQGIHTWRPIALSILHLLRKEGPQVLTWKIYSRTILPTIDNRSGDVPFQNRML